MGVNWNAVQTTMVSSVAASIIIGSITVIARSALSVDKTVRDATSDLVSQAAYVSNAVVIFQKEFVEARKFESAIVDKLEELEEFDTAMFDKFTTLAESENNVSEELDKLSYIISNYSAASDSSNEKMALNEEMEEFLPEEAEMAEENVHFDKPEATPLPKPEPEPEPEPNPTPIVNNMPNNKSKIIRRDIPRDDYIQQRLPDLNTSNLRKR